ncbi:hypothetical protein NicSoilC12_26740 [Arthrobacter sp. NicSoilC12]|nr:hypothetical protein NicSoilC12_26740 [Arthrobacter sp. NicSoilC12]
MGLLPVAGPGRSSLEPPDAGLPLRTPCDFCETVAGRFGNTPGKNSWGFSARAAESNLMTFHLMPGDRPQRLVENKL